MNFISGNDSLVFFASIGRNISSLPLKWAARFLLLSISIFLLSNKSAAQYNGTWYLNGFYAYGSDTGIESLTPISGTVSISGDQYSFSTTVGNWTYSLPNDVTTEPGPAGSPSETSRIKIIRIDADTLLLNHGLAEYTPEYATIEGDRKIVFSNFSSYEGFGAILTKNPVSQDMSPVSTKWVGSYSGTTIELEEDNLKNGVSSGDVEIREYDVYQKNGRIVVGEDEGLGTFGNSQDDISSDTGDYTVFTSEVHRFGNVNKREQTTIVRLDNKRIIAVSSIFELVHAHPIEDGFEEFQLLFYAELDVTLLTPNHIGELTKIIADSGGSPTVVNQGVSRTLELGSLIYEGDVIRTKSREFVRVEYLDQTKFNIGPNSKVAIEKYHFNPDTSDGESIFKFLDGFIQIESGQIKDGFRIKQRDYAHIGLRGTEFTVEHSIENETETTTVDVISGIVDMTELSTGTLTSYEAGEGGSVSAPVEYAQLTVNFPGSDTLGQISMNGEVLTSFPHTVTAAIGSEFELSISPIGGAVSQGWAGAVEHENADIVLYLDEDTSVTAYVSLSSEDAADLYSAAVTAASLSGDDAEENAQPFDDGVDNLLKWAFNMDLAGPDNHYLDLENGGDRGLPVVNVDRTEALPALVITYLRRKDGSLLYFPSVSDDLSEWDDLVLPETIEAIDSIWERVLIRYPFDPGVDRNSFVRIDLEQP